MFNKHSVLGDVLYNLYFAFLDWKGMWNAIQMKAKLFFFHLYTFCSVVHLILEKSFYEITIMNMTMSLKLDIYLFDFFVVFLYHCMIKSK
ncbi:MAG: hypothetical protein A2W91_06990 [Bacteroidetes bacterium GWF2_38_335]|nr:MAG: hypothetical protein A2W91_06990 [Bacteroidetes bacterium GWF2_38_335]OFY80880.1 MAG: hypothetical protein A2281_04715 [Bacteroidetes bacterium RIFOXYA12_FULL_38_20]HBS84963.1 hypothetical protein [Bacteroidales bacterium]